MSAESLAARHVALYSYSYLITFRYNEQFVSFCKIPANMTKTGASIDKSIGVHTIYRYLNIQSLLGTGIQSGVVQNRYFTTWCRIISGFTTGTALFGVMLKVTTLKTLTSLGRAF